MGRLDGNETSNQEGHQDYFGKNCVCNDNTSPSTHSVQNDKKYIGSKARNQFDEIDRIIEEQRQKSIDSSNDSKKKN